MAAALDQLDAGGGQRVEHDARARCAGPSGRACPTRAAPGRRRRRGRTARSASSGSRRRPDSSSAGDVRARAVVAPRTRRRPGAAPTRGLANASCGRRRRPASGSARPGTGIGMSSSRRMIGSRSTRSNQPGISSPAGATGTTPASGRSSAARPAAARPRRRASCRRPRPARRRPTRARARRRTRRAAAGSRPGAAASRSPKPGRSTAIARRPATAELGEQRPPRVGGVAPPVQQHDPGPGALELEHARAVSRELHAVLDQRLHGNVGTRNAGFRPSAIRAVGAPGLGADRPALVVAPAAADLQVARRESLELEPAALGQCDRRRVAGLDVRLEPVQAELR